MPVSRELRAEIERAAAAFDARFLDEAETDPIAARVAARFVRDPSQRWWWQSVEPRVLLADYGNADGMPLLEEWLAPRAEHVQLVVTDDQVRPWIGLEGSRRAVLEAIGDVWLCEFFVTTPGEPWVLFDTHQNLLFAAEVGPG
jgi:hypothetical protein